MMGSLITLAIYAGLAAAALAAVWGAIHAHDNGVRNAQIAADTIVLNKVRAQLASSQQAEQDREAETKACIEHSSRQSAAVTDLDKRGQKALADSRAAIAAANAKAAAAERTIAALQAQASAPPAVDQSCADTLAKGDAALRPVIKARQGVTK